MRKRIFGRQFKRDYGSRQALFRSIIRSLIIYGTIQTTKAKAKAVQGEIDKLVNIAKLQSVASQRTVLAKFANDRELLGQFIKKLPIFEGRQSGYTRITRLLNRVGDQAEVVKFEFVDSLKKESLKKSKVTRKSSAEKKE